VTRSGESGSCYLRLLNGDLVAALMGYEDMAKLHKDISHGQELIAEDLEI
jgi:hypothetical protein